MSKILITALFGLLSKTVQASWYLNASSISKIWLSQKPSISSSRPALIWWR